MIVCQGGGGGKHRKKLVDAYTGSLYIVMLNIKTDSDFFCIVQHSCSYMI